MRKLLLLLPLFLCLLSIPTRAYAQDTGWTIPDFQSDMYIQNNGIVQVTEHIEANFGILPKHGIYRDLPNVYTGSNGTKTYTDVKIIQVTRNGSSEPYEVYPNGDFIEVKIGNPHVTISGNQNYELIYTAKGVLKSYQSYDEFYWNVTGNSWTVPINQARATVTLAKRGIEKTACFTGAVGSREYCQVKQNNTSSVSFVTTNLNPGDGLTVAVGYTPGLFPILDVRHPFLEILSSNAFQILSGILPIMIALLLMGYLWGKKGRDLWFRETYVFDPNANVPRRPFWEKEPVVIEYTPPQDLKPAEMGVLIDEKADQLDVTATIIDLAARGYLKIREIPKKWMFGSVDYQVIRQKKSADTLNLYEQELLTRLFETGSEVTVSSLKQKFYQDLKAVENKLYEDVVSRKLFSKSPGKVRGFYVSIAFIVIILGAIIMFLSSQLTGNATPNLFGGGLIVGGGIVYIFSRFMPRRTALGARLLQRIKGYQLFISSAEKYRQQFFEKENMFNEILPYAIVFGLTEKFAKAMHDMGIDPPNPTWYVGISTFNVIAFGSSMNALSASLGSAIASTPSGSGVGGGGFSGGGFGGGGGGSW